MPRLGLRGATSVCGGPSPAPATIRHETRAVAITLGRHPSLAGWLAHLAAPSTHRPRPSRQRARMPRSSQSKYEIWPRRTAATSVQVTPTCRRSRRRRRRRRRRLNSRRATAEIQRQACAPRLGSARRPRAPTRTPSTSQAGTSRSLDLFIWSSCGRGSRTLGGRSVWVPVAEARP
jgi:hypothetical protein